MNSKKYLSLALIIAGIVMIVSRPVGSVNARQAAEKVTICHRDSAVKNPYQQIEVDADSADGDTGNDNGKGDHSLHTGPVAVDEATAQSMKDNKIDWGDIIPPHNNFIGLNWSTEGQTIYNNGCKYPTNTECPVVETCPTSCGYQGGTVPDGECGIRQCRPTESCDQEKTLRMKSEVSCGEVQLRFTNYTPWFFSADYRVDSESGTDDAYSNITIQNGPNAGKLFGQRFNIVNLAPQSTQQRTINFAEDSGNHLVEYRIFRGAENDYYLDWESVNVESDCEANSTPTPTPTPTNNNRSSLSTVDPSCDSDSVAATHKIEEDGKAISGVRVVFEYNGEQKIAYTDHDGKAHISFKYTGDAHVNSNPDGFSSAANYITKETECSNTQSGSVFGASTQGQVLGATTYAETGIVEDVMMTILGLTGVSMFTTGAVLNVKNKY